LFNGRDYITEYFGYGKKKGQPNQKITISILSGILRKLRPFLNVRKNYNHNILKGNLNTKIYNISFYHNMFLVFLLSKSKFCQLNFISRFIEKMLIWHHKKQTNFIPQINSGIYLLIFFIQTSIQNQLGTLSGKQK